MDSTEFEKYFFNSSSNEFERCQIECLTCTENSKSDNKCITCDTNNKYYPIKNEESPMNCYSEENKPENSFLKESEKIIYMCDDSCKTCSNIPSSTSTNCDICNDNYIFHPTIEKHCVRKCNLNEKWYLDDNNNYICTSECPSNRLIYISENNQCVENCLKSGTCIFCKNKAEELYSYENSCVENCPSKYVKNDILNKCEYDSNKCYYEKYIKEMSLSDLELNIDIIGKNYSNYYPTSNTIVIIKNSSNTLKITISKREDCIEGSSINGLNCINLLRTNFHIPSNENIITLVGEYKKNKKSTSSFSYAFFFDNGTRINNSICSNETLIININLNETNSNVELANEMKNLGIDIYDINDPFFNDHCYPFTSKEGKDVSLKERIEKYYQNVSLCESNCKYIGLNFTENTFEAQCECKTKNSFLFDSLNNSLTGEFAEILTNANFMIFTCYKWSFNIKKLSNNIGSWIIIIIVVIQFIFYLMYLKDGFMTILVQLQEHAKEKKGNPPKKNYQINESTENNFVISDINNDRKKTNKTNKPNSNFYNYDNEYKITHLNHNINNNNNDSYNDEYIGSENLEKWFPNESPGNLIKKNNNKIKELSLNDEKKNKIKTKTNINLTESSIYSSERSLTKKRTRFS